MTKFTMVPSNYGKFETAPEGDYTLKIKKEPEQKRINTVKGERIIVRFELYAIGDEGEYNINASMWKWETTALWLALGFPKVPIEITDPDTGELITKDGFAFDLEDTVGRTFRATIRHGENKKYPDNPYHNITNPQPVGVIDEDDEVDLSDVADMEDDDVPAPKGKDNDVPF